MMPASVQPQAKTSQKSTVFRFGILLTLLCGFLFSSCGEFLRGKPQTPAYLEVQSASMDCLKDVSADLEKFLNSEASPKELDQTVVCINGTLTEFQTRVQGRAEKDAFTTDEIYDIFSTFVKEAKLTREAAKNLIVLKAAVLGGSDSKISKAEITLLKDYLQVVRAEAQKLLPYIKLFLLKPTERVYSREFIRAGFVQLNATLKVLMRTSQISQNGYAFEDFKNLVVSLLRLSNEDQSRVEVLARVNTVLNGAQLELDENERLQYLDNITEFLRLYSLQVNGYANFEISSPAQMNNTLDFVQQVLALLENSLQYKKTNVISVAGIDGLINAMVQAKCFPVSVTAGMAKDFYRTILMRVFEAGYYGDVAGFYGLKAVNLIHIKRELAVYRIYSRMIEKLFTVQSSGLVTDLQSAFANLNIEAEQDILQAFDRNNQLQIISVVQEMRAEFLESVPVIYKNAKMGVAQNQQSWTQNWKDLEEAHIVKALTRFLMLGWAQTYQVLNTSSGSISEFGMSKWYNEFKAFGIETKMLDPRTVNGGLSSLKAANLFTRSGNGDKVVTAKEALEYVGILISGGKTSAGMINQDMENLHCNLPELDVFGNHYNIESCMFQTLRSKYRIYFSTLPYLVAYLERLSEVQFQQFFENMMNVVRWDAANKGVRVESADAGGISTLLYFIESVYATHDTNMNWSLSESEIRVAYPKFKDIATEFAHTTSQNQLDDFTSWKGEVAGYGCFSQDDLIRESFIFLIYNGRTPGTSDFNLFPCLTGKPLMSFSGEVDRSKIVNTFKALSAILK